MPAFNCTITVHLPLTEDFESKFQFHPVEDLPPPDEFKPFPRIYPSKENRGSGTVHSFFPQLYPWRHYHLWSGLPLSSLLQWTPNHLGLGHTSDESRPHTVLHSPAHIRQLHSILLLLMTITQLPWTHLDAGFVCVLFVFSVFVCLYASVKQGPALCWLQCGMFWMCVRRRALPTHAPIHIHSTDSVFQYLYLTWLLTLL